MMFAAFTAEGDSSSRCSTASPSADATLGCYSSPGGSVSSLGSPQCQDFADLTASCASFVPTVTAISTCPDLQWMVQPLISSVAPSQRAHPYSSAPAYPRPASKAHKRSRVDQVSAEEEEKRRIRRERNKQAAAKCRNRRRELTDTLQAETDQLEDEKSNLQNDIANLLKEKERLEFILAAHRPVCKLDADLSVAPGGSTSTSTSNSIFSCGSSTSVLSTVSTSSAVKMSDLEASVLEESLDLLSGGDMETARSVPEVDLSLYAPQDWELLPPSSSSSDLEPLSTPVVTCTPACSTYTSSFVFSFPEADGCGAAHRRGSSSNEPSSDSLSSPTLLAL